MISMINEISDAGLFVGRVSAAINIGTIAVNDDIWWIVTENIYDVVSDCSPGRFIKETMYG